MAEKEEYNSTHDGPTIDAAVNQAKPGGTLDSRLRLSLYTSLDHIGITVGSETMEAIALALPNNAILETSCGDSNNGVKDGTAFPVVSGSVLRYGIIRVSRIGGYDRVSFEFRVKDAASRIFVGFYSSTDGWSGWKKVYTESSKPTPADINAVSIYGDTMTGKLGVPMLDVAKDTCGGYIYGETNSLNFRGGNPSTESYGYMSLAEDGLYFSGNKVYHEGYKPSSSDLGLENISQIAIGSYTGTGYATSANAPTLTFPFNPKFVLVMSLTEGDLGDYGYFIRDIGGYVQRDSFHIPSIEWGDKTLHYYTTNSYGSAFALNSSGVKYGYVAFG